MSSALCHTICVYVACNRGELTGQVAWHPQVRPCCAKFSWGVIDEMFNDKKLSLYSSLE